MQDALGLILSSPMIFKCWDIEKLTFGSQELAQGLRHLRCTQPPQIEPAYGPLSTDRRDPWAEPRVSPEHRQFVTPPKKKTKEIVYAVTYEVHIWYSPLTETFVPLLSPKNDFFAENVKYKPE